MDLLKLLRSFGHVTRGLTHTIAREQNMRIHLIAAAVVVTAGWYFEISSNEWIAIAICIGSVMAMECVNTAVERLADRITTEMDPAIKQAKDTAAAAVFVAAIASVIVACLVFFPKISSLLG